MGGAPICDAGEGEGGESLFSMLTDDSDTF